LANIADIIITSYTIAMKAAEYFDGWDSEWYPTWQDRQQYLKNGTLWLRAVA